MYKTIVDTVYDLVASADWVSYTTIPDDWEGQLPATPFLRLSIVLPASERIAYDQANRKAIQGLLKIQIVTSSGNGQQSAATIAEALDPVLQERTLFNQLTTGLSSLQTIGRDSEDRTKSISEYSVPLTFIGE